MQGLISLIFIFIALFSFNSDLYAQNKSNFKQVEATGRSILIPENIYGFRMDNNGSNNIFMYNGVSIQTTEAINNLGLWENQYPDYEWQLTNYFPYISSPAYYPYGKRFKYF